MTKVNPPKESETFEGFSARYECTTHTETAEGYRADLAPILAQPPFEEAGQWRLPAVVMNGPIIEGMVVGGHYLLTIQEDSQGAVVAPEERTAEGTGGQDEEVPL